MSIEQTKLKNIIEAAMFAVAHPMSVDQLLKLFDDDDRPSASAVKESIKQLQSECEGRGIELKEIASGFRYQAKQDFSDWLSRLWEERPAKYSRAALETLALIAYRQPVTRAEIEDVRGVGVSSSIIKTMIEREWIRVVGHRDVPGRPALYATTKQFLDYFNMKSLEELPTLAEIKDLEDINPELNLPNPDDEREMPSENSAEGAEGAEGVEGAEGAEEQVGDTHNQQNLLDSSNENNGTSEEGLAKETGLSKEAERDEPDTEPANLNSVSESIEVEETGEQTIELEPETETESESESESEIGAIKEYLDEALDDHSDSNRDSFYAEPENQSELE